MAKKDKNYRTFDGNAEAQTSGEGGEGAEKPAKASRAIMLTLEDGTVEKRTEYCRRRFTVDRVSRATIARELTKLQGRTVPYQIVFAATKGLDGGPAKEAAAETASEASAA